MVGFGTYDIFECENALIDEGYVVVRPEEKIYIVKKFGKYLAIITDDDVDVVKDVINKVKDESELHRTYYCVPVEVL